MEALLAVMLAAGLASGVHCVAMCGGIVAAFDGRRVIPIKARTDWQRRIVFNVGVFSTYALAGAAAGTLGAAAYASGVLPAQETLQVAANAMLVLVGLHLAGAGRLLWVRRAGNAALAPAAAAGRAPAAGAVAAAGLCRGHGVGLAALRHGLCRARHCHVFRQRGARRAGHGRVRLRHAAVLLAAGWLASRLRAWRAFAGAMVLGFGVTDSRTPARSARASAADYFASRRLR